MAEVFALNNVLAALLLLVGLEWGTPPDRVRLVWLFAFLLGLALTNQHTIVLLAPAFAVLGLGGTGWSRLRRAAPSARRGAAAPAAPWDVATAGVGLFVVGLLPYLYLPIAAAGDPPVNWGDPGTFHRNSSRT